MMWRFAGRLAGRLPNAQGRGGGEVVVERYAYGMVPIEGLVCV